MKSMENKQGYKKTKIGWIPEDWETKYLKDLILNLKAGKSVNCKEGEDYPDGKRILKTSAITARGLNIREVKAPLNSEVSLLSQSIIKNRLLVCRKNTPEKVGKSVVTTSTYEEIYLPDLIWQTEPTSLEHDLQFLNYMLSTPFFRYRIQCLANGSSKSMVNISKPSFLGIQIPFPEHSEQQKIATILSTWDKAIDKLSDLIEVKEEQKKGLMQRLISQRTNELEPSQTMRFKQIFKPKKVKSGNSSYEVLSVTKSGIVLQSEYFKKKIASKDTSPYLVVNKGDMVMSGLNFWMGAVDILTISEVGIVSPAYKVFEILDEDVNRRFINHFVKSQSLLKALIGSSVQGASIVRRNLDKEMLMNWKFSFPSKREQMNIANLLDSADNELKKLHLTKENLQVQKRGLMQQLLAGKKRVKTN